MATIELGCRLNYKVEFDTSFLFQVAALNSDSQNIVREKLTYTPDYDVTSGATGHLKHRIHRLIARPGWFSLNYTATVSNTPKYTATTELKIVPHSRLPFEVLEFLNPSRYCESDKLEQFAWSTFGKSPYGYQRVQSVIDWVFNHLAYTPNSTGPSSTACDVFIQRIGVCRDFAHLSIAILRALGIPARYVAGYATKLTPPDFHGIVEVYLSGQWFLVDATRLASVDSFVPIGVGRDAADMSFATFVGNSTMRQMLVWANRVGKTSVKPRPEGVAVSLQQKRMLNKPKKLRNV